MTGPSGAGKAYPAIINRGGRPRVSVEETTAVSTRLSVSDYDRLWRLAHARRTSVAALLRDIVRRRTRD